MAFSFFPGSRKIGNFIMKDHVIRYLELKQANPPIVQIFGEHYLPEGLIRDGKIVDVETLSMIAEECLDDWGLKRGKHLIRFTVPEHLVVVRKVAVPKEVAVDEIEGYIYIELGSTIHLPFEDPVFDYTLLTEANEEKQILLFASPKDIVQDYVDFFNGIRLSPVAADISPLCAYRSFYQLNQLNPMDHILLLQFDLSMVNATIFHQHFPFLMRELEVDIPFSKWEVETNAFGEKKYHWPEGDPLLQYQTENIYKELDRIMNYYQFSMRQGKAAVNKILLNGDYPYLQDITGKLSEQFGLPVETALIEKVSSTAGAPFPARFVPLLGLALKEVK
ncbi:type IV pilus biogenesis protein PilM [Weizmannia acidilactici]|uniref:type IV pilus biogenesis protein PilM n=1 Tax=Weizmannia acidilactici TaxID=2607726 RepID=UPI00124F5F9A|nr:pilus assembly protein PilM [Weizmannia acidilactici]GER66184.1 hypothetical protein BpJC4_06550 [Weizmannia acidilactici]GER72124.1 hypothetical protein BpPP18_01910 [Weizmannia acidilactici]